MCRCSASATCSKRQLENEARCAKIAADLGRSQPGLHVTSLQPCGGQSAVQHRQRVGSLFMLQIFDMMGKPALNSLKKAPNRAGGAAIEYSYKCSYRANQSRSLRSNKKIGDAVIIAISHTRRKIEWQSQSASR
jgi:hypothetical protein